MWWVKSDMLLVSQGLPGHVTVSQRGRYMIILPSQTSQTAPWPSANRQTMHRWCFVWNISLYCDLYQHLVTVGSVESPAEKVMSVAWPSWRNVWCLRVAFKTHLHLHSGFEDTFIQSHIKNCVAGNYSTQQEHKAKKWSVMTVWQLQQPQHILRITLCTFSWNNWSTR